MRVCSLLRRVASISLLVPPILLAAVSVTSAAAGKADSAGAEPPPDSGRATPGSELPVATVTLTNGAVHHAVAIEPPNPFEQIKLTTADGQVKYVHVNHVRSIVDAEGGDLSRQILSERTRLGGEPSDQKWSSPPEFGSVEFGSGLAVLRAGGAGDRATFIQVPISVGVHLSRWLEVEPSGSLSMGSLPVLGWSVSALVHGPRLRGNSHLYTRFFGGAYWAVSSEPSNPTLGAGIGLELPPAGRSVARVELGYSRIRDASEDEDSDVLSARVGITRRIR